MRWAAFLFAFSVSSAGAQTIPLEAKAKFELALEQRAESVLLPILGPARSRVVVDATLDFTRIEKFEVQGGANKEGGDQGALFLWQSVGQEAVGQSELLPGIPEPSAVPGFGGSKSYERQNSFPTEFVKRMAVTVILDKKVSTELGDELTRILKDVLDIRPDRGDSLSVMRAEFAPAWKTIWYRPDAVSLLFKYGVIALMTLITLVVVAVCFLKLAEAMDSMAQAQGNQLSMDFGEKEGEGGEEDGEGKEGETAAEEEPSNAIYFDIKPSQVETLWEILHRQDPENIALVVAHLKPEVKSAFLGRLPTRLYSSVVISLGKVKFIEPDVIQTVKEEIERRIESAVGGRRQLFTMLEKADMRTKRELLSMLEAQDPEMAATVRAKVLLFEDIRWLEAREWSLLLGRVKLDDWAAALFEADPLVRDAVKNQMAPKTWAILEQMSAASKPSAAIVDRAQEQVVGALTGLISDGKIENPVERRRALEPEPVPAREPVRIGSPERGAAVLEGPSQALQQEGSLPAEYQGGGGEPQSPPVLEQEPIDPGGGESPAGPEGGGPPPLA